MTRVKRGTIATKKREKILRYTKGFRWGRKTKERAAKEALLHAWSHSFRGRKERKRDFRRLWQVKIGAAARTEGMNYNQLISRLKHSNVALNRKMLAELAEHEPQVFKRIVETIRR